jgi:hypothetical protein
MPRGKTERMLNGQYLGTGRNAADIFILKTAPDTIRPRPIEKTNYRQEP